MQLIAFIAEAKVAKRILDHLALDSTGPPVGPPVARAQPHADLLEPGADYGAADPTYPECASPAWPAMDNHAFRPRQRLSNAPGGASRHLGPVWCGGAKPRLRTMRLARLPWR
jgi:hypothetical protein